MLEEANSIVDGNSVYVYILEMADYALIVIESAELANSVFRNRGNSYIVLIPHL